MKVPYIFLRNVQMCFVSSHVFVFRSMDLHCSIFPFILQDPAGIFEVVELVGNGTYGQVYKVKFCCKHTDTPYTHTYTLLSQAF